MQLEMFINFDGNCREAAEFYAKVFNSQVSNLMTYSQAPPDPSYQMPEADKDKVMYAGVPMGNAVLMLMDMPSGMPITKGNNISPTISMDDKSEVERIFKELCQGGTADQELQKTFFSDLYGMVTDKFGVIWQVLYYESAAK